MTTRAAYRRKHRETVNAFMKDRNIGGSRKERKRKIEQGVRDLEALQKAQSPSVYHPRLVRSKA